ncbi:unnamed protein product, partial [Linum tenue]
RDTLKLWVCDHVLNLVNVTVGAPPVKPCCSILDGLVDLEAALCLCTAINANILGINLNIPISLSLLLNSAATLSTQASSADDPSFHDAIVKASYCLNSHGTGYRSMWRRRSDGGGGADN